ncbi:hypothetical protein SH661x_001818 [Planctomicrobium sp. SH661]|uniref:hypothetical protein n=1 Tax=Planctomicrobium sp. SH661 TaxID=3448124 RepID=UPI003F5AEAAF
MRNEFACVHAEKRAEIDHYETGCDPESGRYVLSQRENITAGTLPALIQRIGDYFGLSIDYVSAGPGRIEYNRLETADGEAPTDRQRASWEAGRLTLYLADYSFRIERRTVRELERADLDGIECEFADI